MTQDKCGLLTSASAAAYISLIFLQAAWHKLSNVESFRGFVRDYQIVPEWAIPPASLGIITAEVLITLTLIFPGTNAFGAFLAIAMLVVYTAAMTTNILRGRRRLECGCGAASQSLSWSLVVRNVALIGVAALVPFSDHTGLTNIELAVSFACGFTLWVGFLLIEQILANASRARLTREDRTS